MVHKRSNQSAKPLSLKAAKGSEFELGGVAKTEQLVEVAKAMRSTGSEEQS